MRDVQGAVGRHIRVVHWKLFYLGIAGILSGVVLLPFSGASAGAATPRTGSSYIYWGVGSSGGSSVGRADLNGTGVNYNFIEPGTNVAGVTLNKKYIYWATANGGTATDIGRAKINGTDVNSAFITGASNPCGVAVSKKYIYWVGDTGDYIGRAKLDGTAVDQDWLDVGTDVCWLAVNSSNIYWGNYSTDEIASATLSGTDVNSDLITTTGGGAFAINSSYIYFQNSSSIGRANLDGSGVNNSFISGPSNLSGIALNGSNIYWATYQGSEIGEANLDGSGVNNSFITGITGGLFGVALKP